MNIKEITNYLNYSGPIFSRRDPKKNINETVKFFHFDSMFKDFSNAIVIVGTRYPGSDDIYEIWKELSKNSSEVEETWKKKELMKEKLK